MEKNLDEAARDDFQWGLKKVLPDYEFRDAQKRMMEYVEESFAQNVHLMIEAGTGTGKSLAYLFPAIKYALEAENPIVVSTATIALQEQLINKEIPLLNKLWKCEIKAALVKGRNNFLCLDKYYDKYFDDTLVDTVETSYLKEWISTTRKGEWQEIEGKISFATWHEILSSSESCLGYKCPNHKECFVNKQKQEAANAHIVITNHHLYFSDLKLKADSSGAAGILPEYDFVILDEAHHVEERALFALGAQVKKSIILFWINELKRQLNQEPDFDLELCQKLERTSHKLFDKLGESSGKSYLLDENPPQGFSNLLKKLKQVSHHAEGFINRESVNPDKIESLANSFRNIQQNLDFILDTTNSDYVSWVEINHKNNNHVMHANPIDVSWHLNEYLFEEINACILTSATLTVAGQFDYLQKKLGLSDCKTCIIDSPFDYNQQSAIYIPKTLPQPGEDGYEGYLVENLHKLIEANDGRGLILFTSYRMMEYAYNELMDKLDYRLLKQGEKSKRELLEIFQHDTHSVLFATDSFREGIDVKGEALSLLVMDKLPFSVPDEPLIKARRRHLDKQGKNSFWSLSLPEAVLKLKQGFGRLIRHRNDHGIFAVFDSRIYTKNYGKIFLNSLPKTSLYDNLEDLKQNF